VPASQVDLAVTSLAFNAAQGGVDFGNTISGADLPKPTTVGLYWSADDYFDKGQDRNAFVKGPIATQTAQTTRGPVPLHVDRSDLTAPPPDAKYLLAVIDPDNTVAESDELNGQMGANNVRSLRYHDIAMTSATTEDSKSVDFAYTLTGGALDQPFTVGVYRSPNPNFKLDQFDPQTDQVVGTFAIPATDDSGQASTSAGTHHITKLVVPSGLPPDTGHEYVFVVADPSNAIGLPDRSNDEAYFRKFVLGAVSHGQWFPTSLPVVPAWEVQMTRVLTSIGRYDAVIPYDWVFRTLIQDSRVVPAEGAMLAQLVTARADQLAGAHQGDVVDVHFIGHSRGAGVISGPSRPWWGRPIRLCGAGT
jgi:hypothetical protein